MLRPALLLLLAAGLAACARPAPSKKHADTVAVAVPDPPRPDTLAPVHTEGPWSIRADGAGPLRIGMTSDEASAAAGRPVVPDTSDFGAQCAYASLSTPAGDTLLAMFSDGRLVRVEPGSASLRSGGVGVGSTEADVRARFPRLRAERHAYDESGKYLIAFPLPDTTLQLVFETDGAGEVTTLRGGLFPFVQYVEGCA